jgi:glycosyltransferase involved in cell wall biosynthesis
MVTPFLGEGGGVGTCAQELTETLRSKGALVDVLHWWPNFNDPRFVDSREGSVPLASLDVLLESAREYDVLHFQSAAYSDWRQGGLSRILARFRVPIVYTIHSLAAYHGEVMEDLQSMQRNIADQLELMGKAERVLLLTEDLVEVARRHYGEHAHKFQVLPNGTHLPRSTPALEERVAALRRQYQVQEGQRLLLFMGRMSQEKGIHELIEAFPHIRQAHPEARLLIAGNKQGDPNVERLRGTLAAAELREGEAFAFAGWVEGVDKQALYELSDFVIMPSYYEHMPLTALEAMSRGKPVILSEIESLRHTFAMREPERRWVIPIREIKSAKAIVEAVDEALRQPEEVARMAARAREAVLAHHTWDKVADRLLELYGALREKAAAAQAEFDRDFQTSFEARFQRVFDLSFEGKVACDSGDYTRGIPLLEEVLRLSPESAEVRAWLVDAYQRSIEQLRALLAVQKYDIALIERMQVLAESLRRLLVLGGAQPAEVSVVMPVFIKRTDEQGLPFLFEALDSTLTQEFNRPYDIILVNDCSEVDVAGLVHDRYGEQVEEIRDEDGPVLLQGKRQRVGSIRIINKKVNSGNDVAPRNMGLVEALRRGSRYITHIDSDDRMPQGRLQKSHRYLEDKASTDMMHGRHRCIDRSGALISGTAVDGWHNFNRKFTFGLDQNDPANEGRCKRHGPEELKILLKDNWVHGGTVMYRSNVLLRIGLDNLAPTVRYGADHIFWQKMSHVATIDYVAHILTEYRLHANSMTQGGR